MYILKLNDVNEKIWHNVYWCNGKFVSHIGQANIFSYDMAKNLAQRLAKMCVNVSVIEFHKEEEKWQMVD